MNDLPFRLRKNKEIIEISKQYMTEKSQCLSFILRAAFLSQTVCSKSEEG